MERRIQMIVICRHASAVTVYSPRRSAHCHTCGYPRDWCICSVMSAVEVSTVFTFSHAFSILSILPALSLLLASLSSCRLGDVLHCTAQYCTVLYLQVGGVLPDGHAVHRTGGAPARRTLSIIYSVV